MIRSGLAVLAGSALIAACSGNDGTAAPDAPGPDEESAIADAAEMLDERVSDEADTPSRETEQGE